MLGGDNSPVAPHVIEETTSNTQGNMDETQYSDDQKQRAKALSVS